MKAGIHPNYETTTFSCVCGESFQAGSTLGGEVKLEICSKCHPLFTGKAKMIDSEGRIERFNRKYKK